MMPDVFHVPFPMGPHGISTQDSMKSIEKLFKADLDPARVWDDTSSFYIVNIFETLVRLEPRTMKIVPALAGETKNGASHCPRRGGSSGKARGARRFVPSGRGRRR